jgi:hypothetical protein
MIAHVHRMRSEILRPVQGTVREVRLQHAAVLVESPQRLQQRLDGRACLAPGGDRGRTGNRLVTSVPHRACGFDAKNAALPRLWRNHAGRRSG